MRNQLPNIITQLDPNGCQELPFVSSATQTYFDYINGASGYIVFVVGAALLIVALMSRKTLNKIPGWLGGIVIVALALGSLPILLPAFGVNLGCGGAGEGIVDQPTDQPVATIPAEPAPAEEN